MPIFILKSRIKIYYKFIYYKYFQFYFLTYNQITAYIHIDPETINKT